MIDISGSHADTHEDTYVSHRPAMSLGKVLRR